MGIGRWRFQIASYDQVVEAMSALHIAGILHLDIKPSNILLNHRGDPKSVRICDFGIARDVMTGDDDTVGTPGYQVGHPGVYLRVQSSQP